MRAQIARYHPIASGENPEIGCVLIRDPRFFPDGAAVPPPPGFAPNIVQGKGYDLAGHSAAPYFAECSSFCSARRPDLTWPSRGTGPDRYSVIARLAPYRQGQQAFKAVVADAYRRQCAITGTHIPPVLQAAHVRPGHRGRRAPAR
jgi:putative restriction endonuclease